MKLWDKGYTLNDVIERFTVGTDYQLDQQLALYDCLGTIAHVRMLHKIGILTHAECDALVRALQELVDDIRAGTFAIAAHQEDVHTAVEEALTQKLGNLGGKLHTGRSRNDQIAVDMRLYIKDNLLVCLDHLSVLCAVLLEKAQLYEHVPMPGRTHQQPAMLSSVGLLFGAYAEALLDDSLLLKAAYELVDQCPLGSAAGYGVNLPLDRQYVADLLGFSRVQNNVLFASNSRGKLEAVVVSALMAVMADLGKMATDVMLFSMPEFGYFSLPQEFCTGSSLMPNKRNPDVMELVRAKSSTVLGHLMQIYSIVHTLPSGYNRDFQETKEPCMKSIMLTQDSLVVMTHTLKNLCVHQQRCIQACTPEIFATDAVMELVKNGMAFREAYKIIAQDPSRCNLDPIMNIKEKTHLGAPGNLGLSLLLKTSSMMQ